MTSFFIILVVLSGSYLFVQLAAWAFFGKVFFPDAGELFENRKEKDLLRTIFPKNMLRLVILIFTGSLAGIFMTLAGLEGWIALLFAPVAGIMFNFLISTVFSPMYLKYHKSSEPNDEELSELSGRAVEDIDPDSFGVIEVKHGRKNYLMRAVSANDRYIRKGEKVVVIYAQDSCCFVESDDHLCDILFDENIELDEKLE